MVWTNLPKQLLLRVIGEVLQSYGAKDVAVDMQRQTVRGKTGFSWQSIGQVITVTVARHPGCPQDRRPAGKRAAKQSVSRRRVRDGSHCRG